MDPFGNPFTVGRGFGPRVPGNDRRRNFNGFDEFRGRNGFGILGGANGFNGMPEPRRHEINPFDRFSFAFPEACRGGALAGRPKPSARKGDPIPVQSYEVVKPLKEGSMSEAVNLVKHKRSGKLYVEKRVAFSEPIWKKRANAELRVLKRMKGCGHVNKLVDYLWEDGIPFCDFILEICDGGNLEDLILSSRSQNPMHAAFDEAFVWHVLGDVAKGLAFLHHGILDVKRDEPKRAWDSICHLDLKPVNIFLSSSGQQGAYPRVVVGDFGCAIMTSDVIAGLEHPRMPANGPPAWWGPEGDAKLVGLHRVRYGRETDMWSLGATIYAMCHSTPMPPHKAMIAMMRTSLCGRRYGIRLNITVDSLCDPEWRARPSAHTVAQAAITIGREKRRGGAHRPW